MLHLINQRRIKNIFLLFFFLALVISCAKKDGDREKTPLTKKGKKYYQEIKSSINADKAESVKLVNQLKELEKDTIAQLLGDYYSRKIDYLDENSIAKLDSLNEIYPRLSKNKLYHSMYEIDQLVFDRYYNDWLYDKAAERLELISEYIFEPDNELYNAAIVHAFSPTIKTLDKSALIEELEAIIDEHDNEWTSVTSILHYALGRNYLSINQREKAMEILNYAAEKSIENNCSVQAAMIYSYMSYHQDDHKEGLGYSKKAISIINETGYNHFLDLYWRILGHQYVNEGEFENANNAYKRALYYGGVHKDESSVSTDNVYVGWTLFKMDMQNNAEEAIKHFDKTIAMTDSSGTQYRMALQRKRWLYATTGQKEKLPEIIQLLNELDAKVVKPFDRRANDYLLRNTLRFRARNQKINALNSSNELQAQKLKNQKYVTTALIVLGITTLILFTLFNQTSKLVKENKKRQLELLSLNSNLKNKNNLIHSQNQELIEKEERAQEQLKTKVTLLSRNLNIFEKLSDELKHSTLDLRSKKKILNLINEDYNKQIIEDIETQFATTNEEYIDALMSKHPDLTTNNIKLCVYLKMGLSSKEISTINYTAVSSVKVARSRLRKKLGLEDKVPLVSYLNNL